MNKLKKINKLWLIPIALLLGIGIYFLPPVHDRLATRVDLVRTRIVYFFKPPSNAVFVPGEENPFTIEDEVVNIFCRLVNNDI